jgi:hypothetical protein
MQLNIEPGKEILLRLDENDIRKSQIHELLPNDFISIEQTQPPIENVHLNHIVLLTYRSAAEKPGRFGLEARIQEVTADNRIILRKLNDPAPCDLRIWPRICLDSLPDIHAYCKEKEIHVIDISSHGTHIMLHKDDGEEPEIGAVIKMKFVLKNDELVIEGKILSKWKDSSRRVHVTIEFQGKHKHNISKFIYQ